MPGHIYKTAKGWRAMVDIGPDAATGKRRQRRMGPYRSRREAELAAAKAVSEVAAGRAVDPRGVTLATYLHEHWLPAREVRGLKPTTLANYKWICDRYLIPALGNVRLARLTPPQVVAFFDNFSKEIGQRGRPRSTRTIALTHRVLSMALAHAMRTGVISHNPAEGARDDLPRGAPADKTTVWSPEQLAQFLQATVEDRLHSLFVLAATTGLRRGELCGLRWEDVDLEAATLVVRRSRVMVKGKPTDTSPKTTAGQRPVGLDEGSVALLADQRRRQQADQQALAPGLWQGQGHVFADEVGRPLVPEYVTKQFSRSVRLAGLPPIRFHDLRHWHATAMLLAGVDVKVVAGRLGHSSTLVTQNIYQHRVEQLDRAAAEKVAGLILPGRQAAAQGRGTSNPPAT